MAKYTFNPFTGTFDYYHDADSVYIRLDGATNCAARIPFDEGIQGQTGGGAGSAKETPFAGYYIGGTFYRTGFYWPSSGEIRFCTDSGASVTDKLGISTGGVTCYTNFLSSGGGSIGTSGSPWNVGYFEEIQLRGNASEIPDLYFVPNSGDTFRIAVSGSAFQFTNNTDGRIDWQSDGSGNLTLSNSGLLTTVSGNLTVVGTTTLATSLTSILYGNAGVVTNATISAPLAFSAGTLSFNQAANFTWTGTHLFQNTTTIADDVKFYIGDNSNFGGNISFENDQDTSGSLLVSAENGFGGEYTYATGLNVRVEDNFYFGSSSHTTLGLFGAAPSSAVISPTGTTDGLAVRKSTISSGIRALSVQAEWDVQSGGTSSSNLNGFNAFAFTSAAATTGITTTSQGGGMRNRQVVRQRSTAGAQIAKMSAGSNQVNLDAGVATVTTGVAFNAEVPVVGAGSTLTNFIGFLGDWSGGTVSGTVGTAYGLFLPALGLAGSNYELWMDTDAGIFLRESGNQIYSSAAATLDIDTTTTFNHRIGGSVKLALTTSLLDINSAVNVRPNILTASRLVKTDGSKNLASLTLSSAYTPTNVTTDRSYDANSTKVDELADVLGTLIADLQAAGILG